VKVSYTGLRQVPRLDLAKVVPLRSPLTVHIEPTNVCNFNCSFCPVSRDDYAEQSGFYERMSMELYRKIVSDLKSFEQLRALKFYFLGEPFLNPDLVEMVQIANQEKLAERIEITSNGSLLCDGIVTSGLDYLRVSIYSPQRSQITRNVERIFRLRNQLGQEKPFIAVKYMPDGPNDRDQFLETYDGIADESIIEGYHNWASTIVMAPPTKKKNCPFPHYMMILRANGDVVPCCVDWNAKLKIGNVKDRSLREIWDGRTREKLVNIMVSGGRESISQCEMCDLPETTPDNLDSLTEEEYRRRKEVV
jgi:radical SAM protein with 4Fe4S-binding SPASM domain